MKEVFAIYKPPSMTPFQALQLFKKKFPIYKNKKISYVGRLDPLAEGVLVFVLTEKIKNLKKFMKFNKTYRAKVIFGFETDSYDLLGIPKKRKVKEIKKLKEKIKDEIKKFKGIIEQQIPPFSSKQVKGKALYHYARKGNLKEIGILKKKVEIKKIKINSFYLITASKLLKIIEEKIGNLVGDFRQKEIIEKWRELLKKVVKTEKYLVADIYVECSSGTYIRSIASELGKKAGVGGVLLELIRVREGKFEIKDCIKLK